MICNVKLRKVSFISTQKIDSIEWLSRWNKENFLYRTCYINQHHLSRSQRFHRKSANETYSNAMDHYHDPVGDFTSALSVVLPVFHTRVGAKVFSTTISCNVSLYLALGLWVSLNNIVSSLYLICRLPFNWRTPIIYCFVMVAQTIQYLISFTIHVNATGTFLSICQILYAFCIDFEQQLDSYDQEIKKFDAKQFSLAEIRINLKMQLRQHIQFHYDIKRFGFFTVH